MKKLANKIFSKAVLGFLLIFIQFVWIVFLVYRATIWNSIIDIVLKLISIILALYIANKDTKPYFKLSWIVLILFLPFFGCTCYFLFGTKDLTKRTRNEMNRTIAQMDTLLEQNAFVLEDLYERDEHIAKQAQYIATNAPYPAYYEQDATYYKCGEELFPAFIEDLKTAKEFIFMEYFIIAPGHMLDSVLDILEQKAKEGVDVRFIYDDIGSIGYVPHKFYKAVESRGIKCVCFNPFKPMLSVIMNNRDHRKICVIDGKVAYTGGINLADEYINETKRFGYWKDTAIRLTGDCVWSFTTMFLGMWRYITKTEEDYLKYKVSPIHNTSDNELGIVQPYGDSPMDKEDVGEIVYINMINHAKKYVYIFTPYLIIGSEMQEALIIAAKSGVDVRIIVPGMPDKKLVYLITESNFAPLAKAGVKIYKYTPGFIHAKCFVVDDEVATVGTINLDYRSLYLHFECGVFMYNSSVIQNIKDDFIDTIRHSKLIAYEDTKERVVFGRVFLMILNLFSPLL